MYPGQYTTPLSRILQTGEWMVSGILQTGNWAVFYISQTMCITIMYLLTPVVVERFRETSRQAKRSVHKLARSGDLPPGRQGSRDAAAFPLHSVPNRRSSGFGHLRVTVLPAVKLIEPSRGKLTSRDLRKRARISRKAAGKRRRRHQIASQRAKRCISTAQKAKDRRSPSSAACGREGGSLPRPHAFYAFRTSTQRSNWAAPPPMG